MTEQEVITELSKLPEPEKTQALMNYKLYPEDTHISGAYDSYIEEAIFQINWDRSPISLAYWIDLSERAAAGEFNTPQPETSESISEDYFRGKITGNEMLERAQLLDNGPQPDDDTMISVSSRHYNDISEKADKYDRMLEIVKENAQNKQDGH